MEKRIKKGLFYKVWEVFTPLIIYCITYYIALTLILYLCSAVPEYFGDGLRLLIVEYKGTVTELVSGLSMLIGVMPLIPMLRQELAVRKANADKTSLSAIFITVILAVSSSVGVNILLSLTGLVQASESYQDVAGRQYSVIFGAGAILFGLIAPIAEEIVFRGLVFNRMRRYYPTVTAIIVSGVLFGVWHGNLVQGVYGGCMGILMAYAYERMQSFLIPCLFHATANLTVYTLTYVQSVYQGLSDVIFNTVGCIALLVISAVCICMTERLWDHHE